MSLDKKIDKIAHLSRHDVVTLLRVLYPIWAVIGIFSVMYATQTIVVPGNASETADNIKDNEVLFRAGIAGRIITQLIQIIVVLLLLKLFKPVSKSLSVLMVVFALVGIPVAMLSEIFSFAAIFFLNGSDYLSGFTTDQLNALALLSTQLHEYGVLLATVFWGLWLFPLGALVYKSGYFPKFIGILLLIGAFGYILDSFSHILLINFADYEDVIPTLVQILSFGELVFMGWVLLMGAKLPERKED